MNLCEVSRFLGRYLLSFSLILLFPLVIALAYQLVFAPDDPPATLAFLSTLLLSLAVSLVFLYIGKGGSRTLHRKESILLVALIWLFSALIGALPFLFSGALTSPIDALFEAMSGLTTTGATVLHPKAYDPLSGLEIPIVCEGFSFYGTIAPALGRSGIEALSPPLLFWRSLMQWLGGMGIVVLFITILPALSMGGRLLYEAEAPGPGKESLTPRIRETAERLWKLYLGLTIAQILLTLFTCPEIPFFDAVTLAFSTISTGGFTPHNEGIAAYESPALKPILLLFMLLGSLNFTLYFQLFRRRFARGKHTELFVYLILLAAGSLFIASTLYRESAVDASSAFLNGAFQTVSAQSSTGFALPGFSFWPLPVQMLLFFLITIGGMSGSTSGGMKCARLWILLRSSLRRIELIFRPDTVRILHIGGQRISDKTALNTLIFFVLLIALIFIGAFFLTIEGLAPASAVALITSLISNAGLSLGQIGPIESCAFLSPLGKIIGILWMALGRLELFILLVLLVPSFWRRF